MPRYENYTPEIQYNEDKDIKEQSIQSNPTSSRRAKRRKSTSQQQAKPAAQLKSKEKKQSVSRFFNWFSSPQARIILGIFLGCLAIYFGASFCGYFSTCIADQSRIASSALGASTGIENPGGEGGARISEFLINEGFGLGSLVFVIWLGALALKLLVGKPRFRTLDFTIKCLVALIAVSLIIGLVTYSTHSTVNWGGYHGTYVNEFIINFVGTLGAVLLSIFMVAVFVVICMRDLINWIVRVRKARAEKRKAEAEARAEKLAREDEIRRMKEQEKLDDIRAGETFEIPEADNTDVADPDDLLEFDKEDGKLYDLTSHNTSDDDNTSSSDELNAESNSDQSEIHTDSSNDSIAAEEKSDHPAQSESINDDINENEQTQPEIANSVSDNKEKEKMVVNVNHIESSDKKHFNSEVEIYESHKYKFPPFNLLREGSERVNIDADEQMANKRMIEQTLLDFGIPITKIEATVGPTVTLYEIVPDTGVKISKIRSLVDDIALRLSANGVRIIAPIPGKGTVGIEVANKDPQTVSMRTVINSKKFETTRCHLPIALGSTISNEVYIADLAKMPHLLVAGATGQGKSVGLNAMIASLLYCKAPHEIKFVMIDPKQVEFSLYNKLKDHYMAMIPGDDDEAVITDMSKVEATLSSLCVEMDNRYSLLKMAHTRNIEEYNAKIRQGMLNPKDGHRFLPYIVVIVDEFGDLIMVSGKNVEMPIARLAQKARAVGMHVIIATQRPSTNVITGIIKANFPARISFKVSSGIDSKTILDTSGAQQLIGRGDMLIFNNSEMVRVQCAFIDTPEVEQICDYVEKQPYPSGPYILPEPILENQDKSGGNADAGAIGERDALFVEVAKSIVNSNTASTSSVQRHFSVGYVRAGKIMDQLEKAGIVGPSQGGKPRAVLVDMIGLESIINSLD